MTLGAIRCTCLFVSFSLSVSGQCSGQLFEIHGQEVLPTDRVEGAWVLKALSRTPKLPSRAAILSDESFLTTLRPERKAIVVAALERSRRAVGPLAAAKREQELNEFCEKSFNEEEKHLLDRRRVQVAISASGPFVLEDPVVGQLIGLPPSEVERVANELKEKRLALLKQIGDRFATTQVNVLYEVFSPQQFRSLLDALRPQESVSAID